jgi:hypothetical protein
MSFQIIQESVVTENENKAFKFKGIAMIKNSLSGNGRHYSDKLVDATVQNVKSLIEQNGSYPLTVMADHPGITSNKTLSTVGKITDMYLEGDNAIIEAEIANTSVGKDVQELIRGKFIEGLSIRATKAKMKKMYIGDKMVNDVLEMELNGVDLVTNPGVKGARVLDILESDENSGVFVSIEEEEIIEDTNPGNKEDIMDYSKLTLEELKKHRPDVIESLKLEHKPLFEAEVGLNELQESVNNLEEEKNKLEAKIEEADNSSKELQESLDAKEKELKEASEKLEEAQGELTKIEEAKAKAERDTHIAESLSKLKFADSVKDKLKAKLEVLESIEAIDAKLTEEVEYLEMVIKESTGVNVSGQGHAGENSGNEIDEEDEFRKMVMDS